MYTVADKVLNPNVNYWIHTGAQLTFAIYACLRICAQY